MAKKMKSEAPKQKEYTTTVAYENAMARWSYLQQIVATIYIVNRGLARECYHEENQAIAKACGELLREAYKQAFKCQELMFALGLADPELQKRAKALAHRIYLRDKADLSWMWSHDHAPLSSYRVSEEEQWKAMLKEMFPGEEPDGRP